MYGVFMSLDRKLIRNVNLDVETLEYDIFIKDLESEISKIGGYIQEMRTNNGSIYYRDYEVGHVDYCPKEIVDKLAVLFGVSVEDLLDDYNLFLYRGQGEMIRKCRESFGMERKEFAKMIHVNARLLGAWELERKRISIK